MIIAVVTVTVFATVLMWENRKTTFKWNHHITFMSYWIIPWEERKPKTLWSRFEFVFVAVQVHAIINTQSHTTRSRTFSVFLISCAHTHTHPACTKCTRIQVQRPIWKFMMPCAIVTAVTGRAILLSLLINNCERRQLFALQIFPPHLRHDDTPSSVFTLLGEKELKKEKKNLGRNISQGDLTIWDEWRK